MTASTRSIRTSSSACNNDVAACIPVNVLGGQFTDAQKAYLLRNTTSHGKTQQFDATAFISGDTSKFFNLPGGPIGIVLGGRISDGQSLLSTRTSRSSFGYTFYNSIPSFKAPRQKVSEAFGEIRDSDRQGHRRSCASSRWTARRASSRLQSRARPAPSGPGTAISSIRRCRAFVCAAIIARAVRAPNQASCSLPSDKISRWSPILVTSTQIGAGSANRPANCAAAGVPAGTQLFYTDSLQFQRAAIPP